MNIAVQWDSRTHTERPLTSARSSSISCSPAKKVAASASSSATVRGVGGAALGAGAGAGDGRTPGPPPPPTAAPATPTAASGAGAAVRSIAAGGGAVGAASCAASLRSMAWTLASTPASPPLTAWSWSVARCSEASLCSCTSSRNPQRSQICQAGGGSLSVDASSRSARGAEVVRLLGLGGSGRCSRSPVCSPGLPGSRRGHGRKREETGTRKRGATSHRKTILYSHETRAGARARDPPGLRRARATQPVACRVMTRRLRSN
jgi:hypothetical protein